MGLHVQSKKKIVRAKFKKIEIEKIKIAPH